MDVHKNHSRDDETEAKLNMKPACNKFADENPALTKLFLLHS
jgi:hypothetical protein